MYYQSADSKKCGNKHVSTALLNIVKWFYKTPSDENKTTTEDILGRQVKTWPACFFFKIVLLRQKNSKHYLPKQLTIARKEKLLETVSKVTVDCSVFVNIKTFKNKVLKNNWLKQSVPSVYFYPSKNNTFLQKALRNVYFTYMFSSKFFLLFFV